MLAFVSGTLQKHKEGICIFLDRIDQLSPNLAQFGPILAVLISPNMFPTCFPICHNLVPTCRKSSSKVQSNCRHQCRHRGPYAKVIPYMFNFLLKPKLVHLCTHQHAHFSKLQCDTLKKTIKNPIWTTRINGHEAAQKQHESTKHYD